jgi:hypothetical protein
MDNDNSIDFNTCYECSALPTVKAVERGVQGQHAAALYLRGKVLMYATTSSTA